MQWSKVAKALQGVAKVGAIDCDDEKSLCSEHGCVAVQFPQMLRALRMLCFLPFLCTWAQL